MKSFIKVLVVFWISQSVCCNTIPSKDEIELITSTISPLATLIKSSSLQVGDNELIDAFYKIIENCDVTNRTQMFEKVSSLQSSNANTVDEKFEDYQITCVDKEAKQNMFETYDEVSTFFKSCIDPKYIQTVEKLHSALLKMHDLQCTTSEKEFKEIMAIVSDQTDSDENCLRENTFQVASCLFSEQDVIRLSKNISQVVDFTVMLIEGNDNECGVVDRIEKCLQKTMKNCENVPKVVGFLVKLALTSFDCKINETIELSNDTVTEPLRLTDFMLLKKKIKTATKECNDEVFQNKMQHLMMKLASSTTDDLKSNDSFMQTYNSVCKVPEQKLFVFQFIDEIAEEMKKCVDTKFVEYVDKIVKPIKRTIDMKCETMDQDAGLILDFNMKVENKICFKDKVFELLGCVFSSEYVKEIVADSSKLNNFTMNLLGGEDKECGTINEIQECVVVTLDSCKNNSTSNLFKYLIKLAMNSMECKVDNSHNIIIDEITKAEH